MQHQTVVVTFRCEGVWSSKIYRKRPAMKRSSAKLLQGVIFTHHYGCTVHALEAPVSAVPSFYSLLVLL